MKPPGLSCHYETKLVALCISVLLVSPVAVFGQGLTPDSYYPLAIGSEWTYRVKASLQGNSVEATAFARMVSKENAGTTECYMREITTERSVDKQTSRQTECYAWQGNKLLLYKGTIDGKFADPEPPQLQLDTPWEIGHRWDWSGTVGYEQCTLSGRVVKRESVPVPAGTFDANDIELVLVTQGVSVTFSRWYAEGVGLVKQTEVIPYDGDSIYFSNELTSYSIAGGKSSGQGLTGSLPLYGIILAMVAAVAVVAVLVVMMKGKHNNEKAMDVGILLPDEQRSSVTRVIHLQNQQAPRTCQKHHFVMAYDNQARRYFCPRCEKAEKKRNST